MLKLNKIYLGDTRDLLKTLPDESIDCCVTSPPYWGLRDYGTASWTGGDSSCDHVESEIRTGQGLEELSKKYRGGGKKQGQVPKTQFKSVCGKCGAIRIDRQIGLEETPAAFVQNMVEVFQEVKRAMKPEGTLWLNLGDTYAAGGLGGGSGKQKTNAGSCNGSHIEKPRKAPDGFKRKDLIGIPWRVAFALQVDGWYLRQDIIWAKPNPMPESVTDRCTKSHEYIFLLSKSEKYFYDSEAIKEAATCGRLRGSGPMVQPGTGRNDAGVSGDHRTRPSAKKGSFNGKTDAMASTGQNAFRSVVDYRNKRSVWNVATYSFKKAHFATFPPKLIEPCILAGCPKDGVVLDPFFGSGTTGFVARENNRNFIGFELNENYIKIANDRIKNAEPQLF